MSELFCPHLTRVEALVRGRGRECIHKLFRTNKHVIISHEQPPPGGPPGDLGRGPAGGEAHELFGFADKPEIRVFHGDVRREDQVTVELLFGL